MNSEAAKENLMALEQLLGLEKESAQKIVGASILISGTDKYPELASFLTDLLQRTFENVSAQASSVENYSCEIVLGDCTPLTNAPSVFVGEASAGELCVSLIPTQNTLSTSLQGFYYLLLAAYTCALVIKRQSKQKLPFATDDTIIINTSSLIADPKIFETEINFGEVYIAGAGAVGNAFLYALRTFKVKGRINIADSDFISGRNLNRCVFFASDDIEKLKVDILVLRAQPLLKNVELIPIPTVLGNVPAAKSGGDWLKKLVVAVDSRRARRNLQNEIPGEVFDASTTGIEEVVIHHNRQPLSGKACLSCVYIKDPREESHEQHIAETLGVSLEHVRQNFVNEEAAKLICQKYKQFQSQKIVGIAFDSLFKELCSEGKLLDAEDRQVIAPLAFVSVLAGAFLALAFIESHFDHLNYNYWRASPWRNPNFRLRSVNHTNPNCEFCNNEVISEFIKDL